MSYIQRTKPSDQRNGQPIESNVKTIDVGSCVDQQQRPVRALFVSFIGKESEELTAVFSIPEAQEFIAEFSLCLIAVEAHTSKSRETKAPN